MLVAVTLQYMVSVTNFLVNSSINFILCFLYTVICFWMWSIFLPYLPLVTSVWIFVLLLRITRQHTCCLLICSQWNQWEIFKKMCKLLHNVWCHRFSYNYFKIDDLFGAWYTYFESFIFIDLWVYYWIYFTLDWYCFILYLLCSINYSKVGCILNSCEHS